MKNYILKPFGYLLFFIIVSIALLPKENLYFYGETKLEKQNIVISNEKIISKFFGIDIQNAKIYYNSIYFGEIKKIDTKFFLLNNAIEINNLKVEDSFKNLLPSDIKDITVNYSIFDPLNLNIYANGEFGELKGSYNLIEKKISCELKASAKMKQDYRSILNQLKFDKGVYSYEYRF